MYFGYNLVIFNLNEQKDCGFWIIVNNALRAKL